MQDLIDQVKQSPDFEMRWKIPFEKQNNVAMRFVMDHVIVVLGGDCWAVGSRHRVHYSFYDLNTNTEEYEKQQQCREDIIHDVSPLFESPEKVFLIMGGNPFRYVTIEYTKEGLGILTDYQSF